MKMYFGVNIKYIDYYSEVLGSLEFNEKHNTNENPSN